LSAAVPLAINPVPMIVCSRRSRSMCFRKVSQSLACGSPKK
jgi:hypothetical protein